MRLFADYHTHTSHSHGKGNVVDNALSAASKGLQAIAITDHGPSHLFGVGVRDAGEFLDIVEEAYLAGLSVPDVRVLAGVEANVIGMDGRLDVPLSVIHRLDMLLCGLHHMVAPAGVKEALSLFAGNFAAKTNGFIRNRIRVCNTKAIVEAVMSYPVDIVTHPGLQMPIDTDELARACARRGTALEINTSHRNIEVEFIKKARRAGALFSIDSDAHVPERVGDFAYGLELAKKAGLVSKDVINAYPED